MKAYPFAIISPTLGTRSETFIYRHMAELLPGQTMVLVRRKDPHLADFDIQFPFNVLGKTKFNLQWFFRGIFYFLKLNKLSPIQVKVEKYLNQHHIKIVLSQYLDHSLKWLEVAQKMGIRFFAHAHGCDISQALTDPAMPKRYLLLEAADGIITMSEHSRKKLIGIGLSGANIHVIPYGIDVPATPKRRNSNNIVRCFAAGRMVGKKAPLFTLEAFRRALKGNSRLRLDYAGGGELLDEARQFVHDYKLSDHVTLHGSQPNPVIQELMKKADIFVQHSRTDPDTGDEEGMPVAILEAMANNLPVVSTRHAGIPEAVDEGASGYLVDEGDIDGMAAYILQLSENPSLRNQMGHAGWVRARKHFSWPQERSALLTVLGLENYD